MTQKSVFNSRHLRVDVHTWAVCTACTTGNMATVGSVTTVGVPVKLLFESEGHVVTVELTTGDVYRGGLTAAEESMNLQLRGVTHTAKNGRVTKYVLARFPIAY